MQIGMPKYYNILNKPTEDFKFEMAKCNGVDSLINRN